MKNHCFEFLQWYFDYKGFEDITCSSTTNQIECKFCESFSLTMDANGTCSQFNLPWMLERNTNFDRTVFESILLIIFSIHSSTLDSLWTSRDYHNPIPTYSRCLTLMQKTTFENIMRNFSFGHNAYNFIQ